MSSPSSNRSPNQGIPFAPRPEDTENQVLNVGEFRRILTLERKRSERTSSPFLLMLAECGGGPGIGSEDPTLGKVASVLSGQSRETDVIGWYQDRSTLGVLFTCLAAGDRSTVIETISSRVKATLESNIDAGEWSRIALTFHFFPDDWDLAGSSDRSNSTLYVDAATVPKQKRVMLAIKRFVDIILSSLLLVILAPVFLWLALAIKATSKGPIFFRQKRVGHYGIPFEFLKFRSMYVNADDQVHRKFVTELIKDATLEKPLRDEQGAVYKIRNDNRVTRIGRFIRRTSLDELPQLLNVLKGDMSLVGPRPAIRYEVEAYQTWHRQRIFAAKPGITGIWQVAGRSRVKFDEMVRMDLRYAMAWSPWLDVKILLLTPFAVIRGNGAF